MIHEGTRYVQVKDVSAACPQQSHITETNPISTMPPYRCSDLTQDLRRLHVKTGDILFVHSSFKSFGPVDGGAASVIKALEAAIGPEGLLLMPSFNLVTWELRPEIWDHATTPSTVGWITEYFRRLPGVHRSDHYSHSVAARGRGAKAFVAGHLSQEGYSSHWDRKPWGRTFGLHSPMHRAYLADAKLLMLGVDYFSSTYIHLVEAMYWQKLRESNQDTEKTPAFPALDRIVLGAFWERTGALRRGPVADAMCRLFSVRSYVDTLLAEVERNVRPYRR